MHPQTEKKRQDELTKKGDSPESTMVQSQTIDEGGDDFGTRPIEYPVRTIEALHGGDYTFEQVAADLIDNSIDAGASHVEVILEAQDMGPTRKEYSDGMQGPEKMFCIVSDNGKGIQSMQRLTEVMSRGVTRPPEDPYQEYELGSFGVGLKESGLSQAYEITIFTKSLGGSLLIMRLSSHAIKKHGKDILLQETEFEQWMRETHGYETCMEIMDEQECGTAILLEGLHKMETEIGEGERSTFLDTIHERLKNYLGMVFYYYITEEGASIPLSDGRKIRKKLKISYGGPRNLIMPLDPFCREWETGMANGTIGRSRRFEVKVGDEIKMLYTKAWFVAHPDVDQKRVNHQNRMKSTKREDAIGAMQGVYVYRNMRLVDFCSGDDPWKGIIKRHDNQNYHRWEVHLPPGENVGREGSEFKLNTSKSQVKFSMDMKKKMRNWGSRPGKKWHDDDPAQFTARIRAEIRNGNDKSPKYKPKETKKKPQKKPITAFSPNKSPPMNKVETKVSGSKRAITKVEVNHTQSGEVISATEQGEKLIVSINKKHQLYQDLIEKLREA